MKKLYLNLRVMAISVVMAMIFLFLTTPGMQAQDIVKVKTGGEAYKEAQDHLTWDDATSDLQAAIDDLADNGGGEIWVKGGTYEPDTQFSADPSIEDDEEELGTSDRYLSFVIREDVTVRGGFFGDETDISQRPSDLFQTENTTILSGDNGTPDDESDNSYHVVIFPYGTSEQAILDGFLITGGNANDGTEFNGRGGGIHARQGGHIINCQITGNNAGERGGGAYLYKGGLIEESEIIDNSSGQEGGGVLLNLGGVVTNSEIRNNTAGTNGGGVFLFSNNSEAGTVSYSHITGNNSGNKGGGAGILEEGSEDGHPGGQIINNLIINNEATGNGGGIHLQDGGYVLNNTIANNVADKGTGVYGNNGGTLLNTVIWGNHSENFGADEQFTQFGEIDAEASYCAIENGTTGSGITDLVVLDAENTGDGTHPYFFQPVSFNGNPADQAEEDEIQSSDHRLELPSAMLDAGDSDGSGLPLNDDDLYGNPRVTKGTIDIGAYEALYYTVTTEVISESGSGTIDPDPSAPVNLLAGANIEFTLSPADDNDVISFLLNEDEYKEELNDENNVFTYTLTGISEDIDAKAEFGTATSDVSVPQNQVRIYPNPADRVLYIRGITINHLKIHSMNGKTVKNLRNIRSSGIDISDLETGLYFMEIEDENRKKHIMKFIKK